MMFVTGVPKFICDWPVIYLVEVFLAKIIFSKILPFGIYLFRVAMETSEQCVISVQS